MQLLLKEMVHCSETSSSTATQKYLICSKSALNDIKKFSFISLFMIFSIMEMKSICSCHIKMYPVTETSGCVPMVSCFNHYSSTQLS